MDIKYILCTITTKKYLLVYFVSVFRINELFHKSSFSVQMIFSLLFKLTTSPKVDSKKATTFEERLAKVTSGGQGEV